MRIQNIIKTVAAVGALALASAAQAFTVTYDLDVKDPGSGHIVLASYGTVTLSDVVAGVVDVTVDLAEGYVFVDTGSHEYFSFNLVSGVGLPTLTSYSWDPTNSIGVGLISDGGTNPSFGPFDYALECIANCTNNSDAENILKFRLTASGLSTASFNKASGSPIAAYFAADILGNGSTGTVASTRQVSVPEPATLGLLGLGLAGVGFARRRKIAA